jgi:thiol-disulfide isomerase/thioredoxin
VCLAIALAAACTGSDDPVAPSDPRTPAIVVADAPLLPRTVDELPVVDVAAFEAMVADVRGTPLVVNFWATWCEPCEREVPLLAAAAEEHRDVVQFLGVDILDSPGSAREFLRRYDVPYPNVRDDLGATRDAVGGVGQPVTVFYGADGQVVARVGGELAPEELDANLDAIVA